VISAHFAGRLDSELGARPLGPAASGAVVEAKEQPLGVPDTEKVPADEAQSIEQAATDASTSAFHLGTLLAGLLMILGGIASAIGIENPRRLDLAIDD
jgi:hypothetical protein